ncbi:MAG: hypothetical protein K8W52_27500, partial [Deltaproteobacteria bacterium]|nr:hypothetical protein [Deltaproteobacteria bacterium]
PPEPEAEPTLWDRIVDGASTLASHNLLGSAVKGLFPDMWSGAEKALKEFDIGEPVDTGPSWYEQMTDPLYSAPDAAQEAHGGGGCTYAKIEGRCSLTDLGDHPVMTFTGTVDGKAVELPGNSVRDAFAFQPFGLGTNIPCTLEFETQGTCTPCMFSVGECGKAAWDAFRAHSK